MSLPRERWTVFAVWKHVLVHPRHLAYLECLFTDSGFFMSSLHIHSESTSWCPTLGHLLQDKTPPIPSCMGFWSFCSILERSCSTLWQHYGRHRVPPSVLRVIYSRKSSVNVISINEVITYLKTVHSLFSLPHRSWCGWFIALGGGWAWLSAHVVWSSDMCHAQWSSPLALL